jgi:hypothetical protein
MGYNLTVNGYHPSHISKLGIIENCENILKELPSF